MGNNISYTIINGVLDLSNKSISEVPKDVFKLPTKDLIKELRLNSNSLKSLPIEIVHLNGLECLHIENNAFKDFPEIITELKQLKKLYAGKNGFTTLPDSFNQLEKLEILNLVKMGWSSIPKPIFQLKNLRFLNISNNPLRKIDIGLLNLQELESLSISRCQLTEIPTFIAGLKNLKELAMSKNQIGSLPRELDQLVNLQRLGINGNKIVDFPLEISSLPRLKFFEFKNNPGYADTPYSYLSLTGVYQLLKQKEREHILIGVIKMKEQFSSAFQRYIIGFDKYLKETSNISVEVSAKKIAEGIEVEIELLEMNSELIDAVHKSFNEYYSLVTMYFDISEEKIKELAKENLLLKSELDISVNTFKNQIRLEQTRSELLKLQAEDFKEMLRHALGQPVNLHVNNALHQAQNQQQSQCQTINISEERNSANDLYGFLLDNDLLKGNEKVDAKEIRDYLDNKEDNIDVEELKKDNSFKNKLGRFISKSWGAMKTAKDVLKYPKDILDALNTLLKLAMVIGVTLDPGVVKQITEFIANVK